MHYSVVKVLKKWRGKLKANVLSPRFSVLSPRFAGEKKHAKAWTQNASDVPFTLALCGFPHCFFYCIAFILEIKL